MSNDDSMGPSTARSASMTSVEDVCDHGDEQRLEEPTPKIAAVSFDKQRAINIRIKQRYNCEEQRIVPMTAPFRGFATFVRFRCRARVHPVQVKTIQDIAKFEVKQEDTIAKP